MCGPATVPITFACTPKCPSASTRLVAVCAWPAVSGRACSPVERVSSLLASGSSQTKLGSSVTASRSLPCGVSSATSARATPEISSSSPTSDGASCAPARRRLGARLLPSRVLGPSSIDRAPPARDPPRASRARPARRCPARAAQSPAAPANSSCRSPGQRLLARSAVAGAERAHHPRRINHAAAGGAQRASQRGAGQQDDADEQQEDHEDVHADVLHEPVGQLVEGLADDAAVRLQIGRRPGGVAVRRAGAHAERARGQRERRRGEQADAADRAGRPADAWPAAPAQQQHAAGADERQGREHARFAEHPAERDRQAMAGATAVPAAVEHEAHEHADGDERQAEHVAPALVEHRQARQAARDSERLPSRPREPPRRARARRARVFRAAATIGWRASARGRACGYWPSRATSTPRRRNLPRGLTIALAPADT